MAGSPIKRERNRLVQEAIDAALLSGTVPALEPGASALQADLWRLLMAYARRVTGLRLRGQELVGKCRECGRPGLTVGRMRARCSECGLEMDGVAYLRQMLERYKPLIR